MNQSDRNLEYQETTWLTAIGLMVLYMIPYGIINHIPFDRYTLPLTPLELAIPFMPWTFVIYISVFIQGIVVISRLTKQHLRVILPVAGGLIAFALLLFVIFPLQYPRELYEVTNPLIKLFHITDKPGNCFPSLHVAITLLLAYCYQLVETTPWKRRALWIWSVLICISVLTTKQHYAIDIIGGIMAVLPCMYIIGRSRHRF